jgi:hypothetical protein
MMKVSLQADPNTIKQNQPEMKFFPQFFSTSRGYINWNSLPGRAVGPTANFIFRNSYKLKWGGRQMILLLDLRES